MNLKQLEKARRALRHAGTLADRNQLRAALIPRLTNDIEVLQQSKDTGRADYRRRLERWRTEEIPENVPVCAIPSEVQDSRLYRVTGSFALLGEMGLAAWIFHRLGVGWWFGVLIALFVTFTLHGIFLHIFDNPERPKETIYRIRRYASLPAIVGFLLALGLGMLARYVYGGLAYMLLPLFSAALWLGTLSLLVLAASLFTLAHILGWSRRHETEYRNFDADERGSSAFLKELDGEKEDRPPSPVIEPP